MRQFDSASRYKLLRIIGSGMSDFGKKSQFQTPSSGSYGIVLEALDAKTNEKVAVKRVWKGNSPLILQPVLLRFHQRFSRTACLPVAFCERSNFLPTLIMKTSLVCETSLFLTMRSLTWCACESAPTQPWAKPADLGMAKPARGMATGFCEGNGYLQVPRNFRIFTQCSLIFFPAFSVIDFYSENCVPGTSFMPEPALEHNFETISGVLWLHARTVLGFLGQNFVQ